MCGFLLAPLSGDLALNSGICPEWEQNQRPFSSQAGTQSTEPHQPGQKRDLKNKIQNVGSTSFREEVNHKLSFRSGLRWLWGMLVS